MSRKLYSLVSIASFAGMALALPALAQGQSVTCQNAEFSPAVLEQFPNIRNACLKVVTENGEQRALFKADVTRIYPSKNALKVRFKTEGGGHTPTRYVELPSDFRVVIDGKPVGIRDLEVGQELTAHVKVREPVIAFAEERPIVALIFVPVRYDDPAETERTAAVMPRTGSNLPVLLWMGGILGLAASIVRITRLRTGR